VNTAVIDIGTNTLLLLIVDGQQRRVVDLCRFGRLGKGLDASGNLAAESIAQSLEICREYRAVLDRHGVATPRVIGTQALREAANAALFVGPAEQILRAQLEVIEGAREAELAYRSVATAGIAGLAGTAFVVVDVGGGSTEFIVTDGAQVVSAVSIKIGAVRLTERHLRGDPPAADSLAALEAEIDERIAALGLPSGVTIVGTAGTATTLAAVSLGLATYDPDRVTGLRLAPAEVAALYQRLARATVAERKVMPGMEPQRADVIVGGAAIYARIMKATHAPVFVVCDRGIRWGLVYEA
jgi:exopolyphosphatase/guanosine-5'-triphosphate,3'-diphosphate pyrophosphatase